RQRGGTAPCQVAGSGIPGRSHPPTARSARHRHARRRTGGPVHLLYVADGGVRSRSACPARTASARRYVPARPAGREVARGGCFAASRPHPFIAPMQTITRHIASGVLAIVPLAVTVWIVWFVVDTLIWLGRPVVLGLAQALRPTSRD